MFETLEDFIKNNLYIELSNDDVLLLKTILMGFKRVKGIPLRDIYRTNEDDTKRYRLSNAYSSTYRWSSCMKRKRATRDVLKILSPLEVIGISFDINVYFGLPYLTYKGQLPDYDVLSTVIQDFSLSEEEYSRIKMTGKLEHLVIDIPTIRKLYAKTNFKSYELPDRLHSLIESSILTYKDELSKYAEEPIYLLSEKLYFLKKEIASKKNEFSEIAIAGLILWVFSGIVSLISGLTFLATWFFGDPMPWFGIALLIYGGLSVLIFSMGCVASGD